MTTHCPLCQSSAPENAAQCAVYGGPLGVDEALLASEALPHGTALQEGHYRLSNTMGQGGFGITYTADDAQLRRRVAIKELFPTGCLRRGSTVMPTRQFGVDDFGQVKERFLEESRVLARFSHPGILQVYGAFKENSTAYMVMEYLEGDTLSQRLRDSGLLPEAEAVALGERIGTALEAVHAVNLIHRDIKPENIVLARDGRAVLIDFGSARGFAGTRHMTSVVTPGYAPLEQYSKQARFGAYTDIYALGATLYHCLTGMVPPDATDRATGVELRPPMAVNPEVSKAASEAVMWAMQMKIENRPRHVREFLDVLEHRTFAQIAELIKDREDTEKLTLSVHPALQPLDTECGFIVHANVEQVYEALIRAFHDRGLYDVVCSKSHHSVNGILASTPTHHARKIYGSVQTTTAGTTVSVKSRSASRITFVPLTVSKETRDIVRLAAQYIADWAMDPASKQPNFLPRVVTINPADGSGLGVYSSLVPPQFGRFNAGAFFLSPLWCLAHGCWIGMLWFVPFLGVFTPFITGFQGNTLAWQNRKWDSVEHFAKAQRIWAWWGIICFIVAAIGLVYCMNN